MKKLFILGCITCLIRYAIATDQELTPKNLYVPCCKSAARIAIFKNWVAIDATSKKITVKNLTDDTDLNKALADINNALSTIEDTAYFYTTLPDHDQRGFAANQDIQINLTNLELRLAALEGNQQTFCCSDEECQKNCPHPKTMTLSTCMPECKAHPASIVNLTTDTKTRAENIIKRTITLFPLYSEADPNETITDNLCARCPGADDTNTQSSSTDSTETGYNILEQAEDVTLQSLSLTPIDQKQNSHALFIKWTDPKSPDAAQLKDNISTILDSSDPLQRKTLHYAVEGCNLDQPSWLKYLIENGAQDQVNLPRADGNTPLHLVAQLAQKQICDPSILNGMLDALLMYNKNDTDALINNDIDPTTSPNAGTPADIAIFTSYYSGNTAAEEKLTNKKNQYATKQSVFMPTKPDTFIPKTFFDSAITGDLDTFKKQLDALKTASNKTQLINMPDYTDLWHRTALHYAASGCTNAHADIVKLLVENGADVMVRSIEYDYYDEQGIPTKSGLDTPLHAAAGAAILAAHTESVCDAGATTNIINTLLEHAQKELLKAENAAKQRPYDISALTSSSTGNSEASIALTNAILTPCAELANTIKNKRTITVDTIGACIEILPFIEGTHVFYDNNGVTYYCAYPVQQSETQKLYFLETMVSQLEGIYGLFNPLVNECKTVSYAFTTHEKNLPDLGLDFIKTMHESDSSASELPTLLSPKTSIDCRKVTCALRVLRVIANIVQPNTSTTDAQ